MIIFDVVISQYQETILGSFENFEKIQIFKQFLSFFCNGKRFLTISNHRIVHFYESDLMRH